MNGPSHRGAHAALRIAIDTGGTFTDCVWVEDGELKTLKVFSTPEDPSRAIAAALQKVGAGTGVTLLHGTTVGTNALLERKGARVALVTTSGFQDVIEIGRRALGFTISSSTAFRRSSLATCGSASMNASTPKADC